MGSGRPRITAAAAAGGRSNTGDRERERDDYDDDDKNYSTGNYFLTSLLLLLQINLSWNLKLKQTFFVLAKTKRYKHRPGFMQNINKDSKNVLPKM